MFLNPLRLKHTATKMIINNTITMATTVPPTNAVLVEGWPWSGNYTNRSSRLADRVHTFGIC